MSSLTFRVGGHAALLLVGGALAACASSAGTSFKADSSTSGTPADGASLGWFDVTAVSGGTDASKGSLPVTANTALPVLGLKPGGPQNIDGFRALLAGGKVPTPDHIPLVGWLNEHATALPAAEITRTVDLVAYAGIVQPAPNAPLEAVLQLGVQVGKGKGAMAAPVALTLVLDRSGSMAGEKLKGVTDGVKNLIGELPAGSRVAVVTFSDEASVLLPATNLDAGLAAQLQIVLGGLEAAGGTNLHAGLDLGLQQCKQATAFASRHVVLLTDGRATVGTTSGKALIQLAKDGFSAGCTTSTIGLGAEFDPGLLNQVAILGGGTAWTAPTGTDTRAIFAGDLATVLQTVATDVKITLDLALGWSVHDVPGFGLHHLGGSRWRVGAPIGTADKALVHQFGSGDAGSVAPLDTAEAKSVPALHPSLHNGIMIVRLTASKDYAGADALQLAKVEWSYMAASTQKTESFATQVAVPGLVPILDGGYAYFTGPIVQRAWLLLRIGMALQGACVAVAAGEKGKAVELLDTTIQLAKAHAKVLPILTEDGQLVDPPPDLVDAIALLQKLRSLVGEP